MNILAGEGTRSPRAMGVMLGFVGVVLSAAFMAGLHIVANGQIDPVAATLSSYVFVDGFGWMFGASVTGMAVAGVGVLVSLKGTALLSSGLLRPALSVAALCCLLVALFPTNRSGPLTVSAEIHRYAAGVAFVCVPIAALLVASHVHESARLRIWLGRAAWGTALILLVFLASNFGMLPEAMQDMRGLFQRTMFVLQLAILALLLCVPTARRGSHPGRSSTLVVTGAR